MSKTHYAKLEKGDIIGGLEVLNYSHTDSGRNRWLDILCFCGKEFKAAAWRIKSKHTKSCGCLISLRCAARNVETPYNERCKRAKKGHETRKANIENIEDHLALACECGSVKWALLKSGGSECHKCGYKMPTIRRVDIKEMPKHLADMIEDINNSSKNKLDNNG